MMLFHNIQLLVGRVDHLNLIDVKIERIWVVDQLEKDRDVLWICASFRIQHHPPLTFLVKHQLAVKRFTLFHPGETIGNDYFVLLKWRDRLLDH